MGNVEYEGNAGWGNYFYIMLKNDAPDSLKELLKAHRQYVHQYSPEEGKTMFVFKITSEQYITIVEPFLRGKYSEIDRDYVRLRFPRISDGQLSTNYLILTKDPILKAYWESDEKIGMSLPDNAEVWSKAKRQDEVYGFVEEGILQELH